MQIRTCLDVIDRIWRKEDAQLKSRKQIWSLFKTAIRSILKLDPEMLDSFERCCKPLRYVQQVKNLFTSKACDQKLKEHVDQLYQMVLEKFAILEEVFTITDSGLFI